MPNTTAEKYKNLTKNCHTIGQSWDFQKTGNKGKRCDYVYYYFNDESEAHSFVKFVNDILQLNIAAPRAITFLDIISHPVCIDSKAFETLSKQSIATRPDLNQFEWVISLSKRSFWNRLFSMSSSDEVEFSYKLDQIKSEQLWGLINWNLNNSGGLLHITARFQTPQNFKSVLDKTSDGLLNNGIPLINNQGNTVLHLAAQYQSDENFITLLSKLSIEALKKALTTRNLDGNTVLEFITKRKTRNCLIALIKKANANDELLNAVSLITNKQGKTLLQFAGEVLDRSDFMTLLAKLSTKTLELGLTASTINGTLYSSIIRHISEEERNTFILKFFDKILEATSVIADGENNSILHLATLHLMDDEFTTLLKKAKPEHITRALLHKDMTGNTPLHLAAQATSDKKFLSLIEAIDTESILGALFLKNNDCRSFLHIAALNLTGQALSSIIQIIPEQKLYAALNILDKHHYSALNYMAQHHSSIVILPLIKKLNDKLNDLICLKTKNGHTLFDDIARHQGPAVFLALMKRLTPESIEKASRNLATIATYQSHDAFAVFIEKITHKTDKIGFDAHCLIACIKEQSPGNTLKLLSKIEPIHLEHALIQVPDTSLNYVIENLLTIACYAPSIDQYSQLQLMIINMVTAKSMVESRNFFLQHFFHRGMSIDIILKLREYLLGLTYSPVRFGTCPASIALHYALASDDPTKLEENTAGKGDLASPARRQLHTTSLQRFEKEHFLNPTPPQTILLGNGELIDIATSDKGTIKDGQALCILIWNHGLASWLEYRSLISTTNNFLLKQTLFTLHKLGAVLTGVNTAFPDDRLRSAVPINDLATQGKLLIKIIRGGNLIKFLKPFLTDFKEKPALRKKKDGSHKYRHLTDSIETYSREKNQTKEIKPRTRKTSATLISPKLNTRLFCEHYVKCLVGLGLNAEHCTVKAMLSSDRGTFFKQWVGTESAVQRYKEVVAPVNYTDEKAFLDKITMNDQRINETLVEVSKEALSCIIMGNDSPGAQKLALFYQSQIKERLGIELPIIIYDSGKRTLLSFDQEILEAKKNKPATTCQPPTLFQPANHISEDSDHSACNNPIAS